MPSTTYAASFLIIPSSRTEKCSLGVRGCDLVSEEMPYQLDLFMDETKREKIKKMDQVVDEIRGRFGYQSIQRAFMYQDKILAQLNAKEHTVHPQAYFHG